MATTTKTDPALYRVTTARPARSRRPAVAVLAVLAGLALLTLGIALGRGSVDQPGASPSEREARDDLPSVRTEGDDRTERGAVTAATGFLHALTNRRFVTDPAVRAATIRHIVIPADRNRLAAQSGERSRPAGAGDPLAAAFAPEDGSVWRLAPIGYRIDDFTGDTAVVEVWAVQVTAGTGSADVPAAATWTTTRLPLQWTAAGWKLDLTRATTTPGPTPGAGPAAQSPDLDVVAADGRFTEYRHVVQ